MNAPRRRDSPGCAGTAFLLVCCVLLLGALLIVGAVMQRW